STFPHPEADLGTHRLRYGLFVHDGVADLAGVHQAAERFNNPVAVIGTRQIAAAPAADLASFSLADIDAPNVTIETVKKAEKSDALVLRVFEHANIRAEANIRFGLEVKSVRVVNLMEEEAGEKLELTDNGVTLKLRPLEIVTPLVEVA